MKMLRAVSVIVFMCGVVLAAHADQFSFVFSGPGVTGSGTLDATNDGVPNEYFVTGGSAMINGSSWSIAGGNVLPPANLNSPVDGSGGYYLYDNVLYTPPGFSSAVDFYGLLFGNGSVYSNVYLDAGTYYYLDNAHNDVGSLGVPIQFSVAPTPEPASVIYSGTALLMVGSVVAMELRRRKLATDAI